ncbi:MAG: hypothetical protein M3Q58_12410 [Bacteroidota bacterium]|nr:hypothetical protein [Bacteroidota bacterium]
MNLSWPKDQKSIQTNEVPEYLKYLKKAIGIIPEVIDNKVVSNSEILVL